MARAAVNREALDPGSNDGPLLAVMDEAVALEEEAARGLGTFRSLRYRDYRLLWTGTVLGSAGQWIQQATVPWLAYDLTGSGFLLGAVNAVRSGPLLILGPLGGVAADRIDRKRLLLSSETLLVLATAAMAAVIFAGALEVWHLFAFSLVSGVAWALNNPARQSILPNLVPKNDLMNAVALNSAGFNSMRVFGPSLGGFLLLRFGAGENFFLQSIAYVGVATMVLLMVVPRLPRATTVSIRENLVDGAEYVWRHPMLRAQMMLGLVPMVVGMPYMTLLPIFAKDVLHANEAIYGLFLSSVGVGAVIGTLALASLGNLQAKGKVLLGAIFALGVIIILFSLSRSLPLSLLLLVMSGAAQMAYLTTNMTMIQLTVEDEMRGRVLGLYMLNQGLLPLGALGAGILADLTSAPTAAMIQGALVCAFVLVFAVQMKSLRAA